MNKNVIMFRGDTCGCYHYRIFYPAYFLSKFAGYNITIDQRCDKEYIKKFPLAIFQRQYTQVGYEYMKEWKDAGRKLIYDIDDDFINLHPKSIVRQFFESVNGEYYLKKCIELCDEIIVSTDVLKNVFSQFHSSITVLQNSVDSDLMLNRLLKKTDKIKIIYAGSDTHRTNGDFDEIKDALIRISEKKNVQVFLWGIWDKWCESHKFIRIGWIPVDIFQDKLNRFGFHVGICPLNNNIFNESKSNIKFLEYTLANIITISSKSKPYECIKNGDNGFVVNSKDRWYDIMNMVINSYNKFSNRVITSARRFVNSNHLMNDNYLKWDQVFSKYLS